MLLHTGAGPNLLMSIPRDSHRRRPRLRRQQDQRGLRLSAGPQLLVQTIENETGIRVDHYVEIGFGGFVNVVDAVGGIEICPKFDMKDPLANLDIEKGCQEVDGPTALGYARSRKTDTKFGDLGRAARQREVVSAIGSEAVSPWSVLNPVRYFRLNMAGARAVRVSEGTAPIALARLALGDDPGRRRERPDLRRPRRRLRGQLGPRALQADVRRSSRTTTRRASRRASARRPASPAEHPAAQRSSLIRLAFPSERSSEPGASTSTRAVTPIRFLIRSARRAPRASSGSAAASTRTVSSSRLPGRVSTQR